MNTHQQSGFPSGYCPPGSAIDDCPPVNNQHTNLMKSFIYTILIFLAMCLASYIASAQSVRVLSVSAQSQIPQPGTAQSGPVRDAAGQVSTAHR